MITTVGTSPGSDRPDVAPGVVYFVRSRNGDQWDIEVVPVPPDPAEQIAALQATVDALLALIAGE